MGTDTDPDRRDNWWHVVAATPLSTLAVGLIGGWIGTMLFLPFWLLWPVACWFDGGYVRAATGGSTPSRRLTVVAGLLGFLSIGLLTWVIAPYYLYKRREWVGTP